VTDSTLPLPDLRLCSRWVRSPAAALSVGWYLDHWDGWPSSDGHITSVCIVANHPGQLNLLPSVAVGREVSTDQSAVMPCGWE